MVDDGRVLVRSKNDVLSPRQVVELVHAALVVVMVMVIDEVQRRRRRGAVGAIVVGIVVIVHIGIGGRQRFCQMIISRTAQSQGVKDQCRVSKVLQELKRLQICVPSIALINF